VGENAQSEPVLPIPIVAPGSEPEPAPAPPVDEAPVFGPPSPSGAVLVPPVIEAADPSPTPPPGAAVIPPPLPGRSQRRPDDPVNWTPKAQGRRRVFVADARGNGHYLRTTWHTEGRTFVMSIWNEEVCLGAVRVPVEDAAEMVSLLMDGLVETVAAGPLPEPPSAFQLPARPSPWDDVKAQLTAWARGGAKKAATLKHLRLTTEPRQLPPQRSRQPQRQAQAQRQRMARPAGPACPTGRPQPRPTGTGPRHSGPHPPVPPARRRSA
jgi:hypothetical protein